MEEKAIVRSRKILSLIVSFLMIFAVFPMTGFGEEPEDNQVTNVTVSLTAQADGEFLCAPQISISVSSDEAEKYGFTDSIEDGVSALDALVKLHEIKYGESFTAETAENYLVLSSYGNVSKSFGYSERYSGFALNGAYPNDGTESDWGGYNGTVETTQQITDGDTVEFFIYADDWSDELSWFSYKGNAVKEITAVPGSSVKLNLKSIAYMMGYLYIDADAIHTAGSSVSGAQPAWVDVSAGTITDIDDAVTDENGYVSITVPDSEGVYYLTAYTSESSEASPLIMSLTKITADEDAPRADPCALSSLSAASFDSNPAALTLTPGFSPDINEYSVPAVNYPSIDLPVFRSVYVKAAAESEEAVITAECSGITADIVSGDPNWAILSGALTAGKNNIIKITVAASSDENAAKRTYYITVPMKDETNTPPPEFEIPDRVTDYLCIGSRYTNGENGGYGINPEATLTLNGDVKSLGSFGGYITYYYEKPLTDNPKNKYGMDFYVTGNSFSETEDSASEPGQVYVSEDGNTWYALAGSEHYEDKALWDYTIIYTKGEDGKAYWTDNYGNSIAEGNAQPWPEESLYTMNNSAKENSYTYTGILLKSQQGTVTGDGTADANAAETKFGYADCYSDNISDNVFTDANPYVENPSKANGFDLAWAVDENGIPVDVSNKEFHYIKVATASNIWAGGFGEKSTEVKYVVRTPAQTEAVGKTETPAGVTISDGTETIPVSFTESQKVYPVNVGSMKYVSIKVNGAESDDNIYINNQRVSSDTAASGFKVTEEKGETLVRVIVQNGEKEPAVYLLKLTGNASESDELIEGVRINAGGTVREAETSDGQTYTVSVGHRVDSVSINPVAAPDVTYTVNSEAAAESYSLDYGENLFTIAAETFDGGRQTVTLKITRENAPAQSGNTITVKFALYGDEEHGETEIHTYKNDRSELPVWISETSYKVDAGSTVLDVFEKALSEAGISWKNDGGNYISEINGLAQFDNGSLSGWMYLYNGKHSSLGVAEQSLKNGDRIIFHYTDDYTQEQGSEEWTSNSSVNKPDSETEQPEETMSFIDVEKGSWYEDAVSYVVINNLFRGISENEFMPEGKMTRAMFVTVLYRLENPSAVTGKTVFEDVPEGEWYSEAVSWAVENGIVKGTSETEFEPDAYITREQMAAVIYRYVGMKGWNTDKSSDLSQFEDVGLIQSWALDAMKWANAAEIVKGTGDSSISPSDTATRAQTAVIFMRLCENIIKYGV